MRKSVVIAIIVAALVSLVSCKSGCDCGYAQAAPQQPQMEANL